MERKTYTRYSEAFKIQIIRELEDGEHASCHAAERAYGMRSRGMVSRWAKQYGREHLTRRFIRVETKQKSDEMKKLKMRIRELESVLSDTTIDLYLEREYVKIACREAKIKDIESFKKKTLGKLPMGRSKS